ncbi:unnamed protein product [Amoebophrya sp. A120]|nr:unnamed protein product [Amoebophrya sp. A120]|eukprot:GSA120T00013028001.1
MLRRAASAWLCLALLSSLQQHAVRAELSPETFAAQVESLVEEKARLEAQLPKRPMVKQKKPPVFVEGLYRNPVFNGEAENTDYVDPATRSKPRQTGGASASVVRGLESLLSANGVEPEPNRVEQQATTTSQQEPLVVAKPRTKKVYNEVHEQSQWTATKLAARVRSPLRAYAEDHNSQDDPHSEEKARLLQGSTGGVEGVNLALNKGVALSSVGTEVHPNPAIGERQGSAGFAVDGKKGMSFFQDRCAQTWSSGTDTDDFPWFRIDLGRSEHVGLIRLWPRNDVVKTLTHFEFRVGGIGGSRWDENMICGSGPNGGLSGVTEYDDDGVVMIPGQMNSITCEGFGRYVFIVIKLRSAVLALCEVEVVAQGPVGIIDQSVVAGQPFNIYLQGIGMGLASRVRIVDDTILCGTKASLTMSSNVFPLTAPTHSPDQTGAMRWEQWSNVTIGRSGYYKICWCGGNCDVGDDVFSQHAVRLIVTGSIVTIANGAGTAPTNTSGLENGIGIINSLMDKPQDVAVMDRGVFVAEGHRLRYLDLIYGQTYRIAGGVYLGNGGNGGLSKDALLNVPAGITLDKRYYWEFMAVNAAFGTAQFQTANGDIYKNTQQFVYRLYFTEENNHQVRMIEYSPAHLMTTAGMTEALLYATTGIISQIAGTGSPGFSGDGGSALLARLDSPNGIFLDSDNMLWVADTLNNRIRIVYLDTLSSRYGKIYTAIGEGPQGYGGDGGNSLRGQINLPKGVVCTHVDPLEEDDEEGRTLRAVVYFSEHGNHIGRQVQMHFGETCGLQNGPICGIIDTYVGTPMQSGYMLGQLRDTAFLNSPVGLTFNSLTNMLIMSDRGNHRLIGMPTAQVVSMGCWRDSTDPNSVLLASLENPNPPSQFLVGDYLQRTNPVEACFFESLRLGYVVFGIRQNGMCVSNKNAENTYKTYKSSTTCVDGLGSTSDNNIYKIIAPGQSLAELGRVFALANAPGVAGYAEAATKDYSIALNAISSPLNAPSGIDVDPASNNLWIADTLNNRVRVIYGQAGPNSGQTYRCTNGMRCIIEIRGNGMMTTDKIGIFPHGTACGDPKSFFAEGFKDMSGVSTNPASLIPSNMFDAKDFDLGMPVVEKAAHFQVCFCPDQSARGATGAAVSATRICRDARYFTTGAGILTISGPDRLRQDVRVGEAFHLLAQGVQLHIGDRIMFRNAVDPATGVAKTCMDNFQDGNGADLAAHIDDLNMFMYEIAITPPYQIPRDYGNSTSSLWQRVELKRAGVFLACWCDGQREPPVGFRSRQTSDQIPCRRRGDYQVQAAEVHVHGPYTMDGTFYAPGLSSVAYTAQVSTYVQLKLHGTGFRRSDRIRIVKKLSATHKCGTLGQMSFSNTMFGRAPTGPPSIISDYSATWTDFRFKDNQEMLICFCGRSTGTMEHVSQNFPGHVDTKTHGGCIRDQDFNILAGVLQVKGLSATQDQGGLFRVDKQTLFTVTLKGIDFTRSEKIALVENYIACGSSSAGISSAQLIGDQIENIPMRNPARTEISWSDLRIDSDTILKICYCGGDCDSGASYMLEIGAILVGNAASHNVLPTSLVTSNPTEEKLREFNHVHSFPVQYWKAKLNVLYGYILHVKTRDAPAEHSGSAGPFHIYFCRTETECMPQFAVIDNLKPLGVQACKGLTCCGNGNMVSNACQCKTGYSGDMCEVQVFTKPRVLISPVPLEFRSIRVVAGTNDAWFCEYIEVFFGGDQDATDVAMYDKSNKYPLNTWLSATATPRSTTTGKYYFYESNWRNANQQPAFTFPFPLREIATSYYVQSDPCNGCSLGYECVQLPILEAELLWRDFVFKKTPDRIGSAQATCQPVCGDGYVVADEQCDDGNILPDDGCSPLCEVEHAWRCVSNYVEENAKVSLKSVCALEFCNERPGGSVLTQGYGLAQFQRGGEIGYICSENAARTLVPRDDKYLRCYAWTPSTTASDTDICPSTLYQYENFKNLAGTGFDTYTFRPKRYTKLDCRAYDMVERAPGRTVDTQLANQKRDAPFKTQGYRTKEECRDACFSDPDCVYSQFWIQGEQASTCEETFNCHSNCKIVVAYTTERPATASEKLQYGNGYSYLYAKVRRAGGTQDGDYYCSLQQPPRPVSSYYTQDFGAAIILFDDAIQNVRLMQEGFCTDFVAASADGLIGGTEAQCIWKSPKHLYLQFGGRANIGNTEWALMASVTAETTIAPVSLQRELKTDFALAPRSLAGHVSTTTVVTTMVPVYDYLHQVHGGPSYLVFKSSHLRPRGQPDFPPPHPERNYGIAVRSHPNVVARTPEVILRAPESIGTCSDIEFRASESHTSGMRRWASVKWTCLETRPLDENDLLQVMRDILYNYCTTHVQPLLDSKPWCGNDDSNDPDIIGVRPCDMKVVIPLSVACQLLSISLRVDVVTFNGLEGRAEATASRGSRNPFLPSARAVGPTKLHLPMEVDDGKPIRFEVTTRTPEYLHSCYRPVTPDHPDGPTCIQSSPLFRTTASLSTTQSPQTLQVADELSDMVRDFIKVRWYYGNFMIGPGGQRIPPGIMELYSVDDQSESVNQNVLLIPSFKHPHMFYQPGAIWYFAAAVTFSTRAAEETAFSLVPFEVSIGTVQQPKIHLRAPLVVQGTTCGFIVDASKSSYTELRAWSTEHGGGIPNARRLTESEKRKIVNRRQLVTDTKPRESQGFSEEAYQKMAAERTEDVPALARWLEAGGNSTTFLRELQRRYDEEMAVRWFNKEHYRHQLLAFPNHERKMLEGQQSKKLLSQKLVPITSPQVAAGALSRDLQADGFATTTTTTTKTFDMASWDGLTHIDDPRFVDCLNQFPDMKEIENPSDFFSIRAICDALNKTSNYEPCMDALVSARVQTQTLPDSYCRIATTNCTTAVSPAISEPAWCKPQPLVVDPNAVTSVGSSPAREHRMVYRWSCRRLASIVDDEQPKVPTALSILKEVADKLAVCQNAYGFVPALELPVGLAAGLYEFTVELYDRATKDMVFNVQDTILVQVLGVEAEDIFPVHIESAYDGTTITDMGRGPTCIRADDKSEKRFAMRFRGTDPREPFRNLMLIDANNTKALNDLRTMAGGYPELNVTTEMTASFQKYRRDLGITITESTQMLEYKFRGYDKVLTAGFVYDYLVVGAEKSVANKLTAFYRYTNETTDRLSLTKQHLDYPYRFPEENLDPDGQKRLRGVHGNTMEAAVRPGSPNLISVPTSGIAVKDMFQLDMIFATNYAPLLYKYVYAEIPTSLQQAFVDCRDFQSSPVIRRNATKYLAETLTPVFKEMREFSFRSDMETTFAQGNYLIGGIARDRLGAEGATYACIEVKELHQEDVTYSPIKKLEALDEFVRRTSDALAQLRGNNQPGGEIALIYEVITKDMPNFWTFDWETMAFENDPTITFVQPLDKPPLVSKAQRERAEKFVRQVLNSLAFAAGQLASENLLKPDFQPPDQPSAEGQTISSAVATNTATTAPPNTTALLRELEEGNQMNMGGGEEKPELLELELMQDTTKRKTGLNVDAKLLSKVMSEAARVPAMRQAEQGQAENQQNAKEHESSSSSSPRQLTNHAMNHLMTHKKLNTINELYHINTLANSLLLMTKQIGVFKNSTIDILAADAINVVMRRFRDSNGMLFHFDTAASEFLEAESILLERTRHLHLARNQRTVANFNFTDHIDAKLSKEIISGVVNIAESYVAGAAHGEMRTVTAPYYDHTGKPGMSLSISISKDKPALYETGAENNGMGKMLVPNANLVGRWPFPYTRVALMGTPMTDVIMNPAHSTSSVFHMNYGDADMGANANPFPMQPPGVTAALMGVTTTQAPAGRQRQLGIQADTTIAGSSPSSEGSSDLMSPEDADLRKLLIEADPARELSNHVVMTTPPPSTVGNIMMDFNRHKCWEHNQKFMDDVSIYAVSWPKDPFFYAYGDAGIRNNVTLVYSLGLRSCGEPLLVQKIQALELDFRLETDLVRENRYGYGDMNPYRVVWWKENLLDDGMRVTAGGERTQMYRTMRGWTDGGCITRWSKAREDMVYATCDHIINQFNDGFAGGYQIWGLETLPKPAYAQPGVVYLNKSIHNNITYWILFILLLFYFVRRFASHADKTKFWPSEATLSQILFLLAEQERLERLKEHERLQEIAREEAKDPFYKVLRQRKLKPVVLTEGVPVMLVSASKFTYEFFFKVNRAQERVKRWWRRRERARMERGVEWRNCVRFRHEEMMTNEVRELRSMREKTRNRLYEHFFQQTELHPDDIHVDGQNIRIETIHDILGSAESSEYESSVSDGDMDGMPQEAPDVPKLEDVLFDNEPKNELEALLGLEGEDEPGKLPELPPGWQHIVREDTGERAYRNLLTDFVAMELPKEAAWGAMVLPPGWMLCFSHKFDRAYYFYPSSGKTQWNFPKPGDEIIPEDPEKHMTLERLQQMRQEELDTRPEYGPDGKRLETVKATQVRGSLVQDPSDGRIDPKATSILNETFKQQTLQKSTNEPDLIPGPGLPKEAAHLQQKRTMEALDELAAMGSSPQDASVVDMAVATPGPAAEGKHKFAQPSSSSEDLEATAVSVKASIKEGQHNFETISSTSGTTSFGGSSSSTDANFLRRRILRGDRGSSNPLPAFVNSEKVLVGGIEYTTLIESKNFQSGGSSSSTCRTPRGKPPEPNEEWRANPPTPPLPSRAKRRRTRKEVAIEMSERKAASKVAPDDESGGVGEEGRAVEKIKDEPPGGETETAGAQRTAVVPSSRRKTTSPQRKPPGDTSTAALPEFSPPAGGREEREQETPPRSSAMNQEKQVEGAHRKSPVQSPRNVVTNAQHAHVPGRPPAATGQTDVSLALPPPQGTQLALRNTTAAQMDQFRPTLGGVGENAQVARAGQQPDRLRGVELPKNWEVHVSSDGKIYYVNVISNITQWEVPVLPFPWQEKVSRSGRVYYMNDQTGVTQWQWPDGEASGEAIGDEAGSEFETEEDLERSMTATSPGGGLQLALPGATFQSGTTDGAVVPYSSAIVPYEEENDILAEGENVVAGVAKGDKEWGVDDSFDKYKNAELAAQQKKIAIAKQHRTAHQIRGIRDFVRQHELGAYEQNWGKYLDSVRDKKAKLERSKKPELGQKMQLDKEELRDLFPIVQRLQWTRWTPQGLYVILFLQRNHFVRIFENYARPSKAHRENLWETRLVIAAFIFSWAVFGSHATLNEDVAASEEPLVDLLGLPFDMGFQGYFIVYIALADIVSSLLTSFFEDVFFHPYLDLKEFQLDEEMRQQKMKYWHKVSATGDAFLTYLKISLTFLMFIFAAVTPAPRSAATVIMFLLYFGWLHVLRPAIHAGYVFTVLFMATKTETFDGYLSWYQNTMDFLYVGVSTAEFLAWRLHRIMKEAVILKQVHESEYAFELWQAVLDTRKAPKAKSRYRQNMEDRYKAYG